MHLNGRVIFVVRRRGDRMRTRRGCSVCPGRAGSFQHAETTNALFTRSAERFRESIR